MPFEYSCFISYRHYTGDLGISFIEEFHKALSDELELRTEKKVFIDRERLKPGYFYNEVLAESLCRSVCLIVIFSPTYFDIAHTYCAREYKAMEKLEKERLKLLANPTKPKHGLIIPVIFRGGDQLPAKIKNRIHYADFQSFSMRGPKMQEHGDFAPKIEEIADYIYNCCLAFDSLPVDPCINCSGFTLPKDRDIKRFLEGVIQSRQAFPGRGVI
jgi:hypothetical protein